jgi:hypothetical protein
MVVVQAPISRMCGAFSAGTEKGTCDRTAASSGPCGSAARATRRKSCRAASAMGSGTLSTDTALSDPMDIPMP